MWNLKKDLHLKKTPQRLVCCIHKSHLVCTFLTRLFFCLCRCYKYQHVTFGQKRRNSLLLPLTKKHGSNRLNKQTTTLLRSISYSNCSLQSNSADKELVHDNPSLCCRAQWTRQFCVRLSSNVRITTKNKKSNPLWFLFNHHRLSSGSSWKRLNWMQTPCTLEWTTMLLSNKPWHFNALEQLKSKE